MSGKVHHAHRGVHQPMNGRAGVRMARTLEEVVEGVRWANNRTRLKNLQSREARDYQKAKSKISLPTSLEAWLKKEV